MTTITMDPRLRKLLDDLPVGDPDKAEEPRKHIAISCPWLQGEHVIPVGETSDIDFGMWYGPPMYSDEIPIRARVVETGEEVPVTWEHRFFVNEATRVVGTINARL